jgi:hypothetical protein
LYKNYEKINLEGLILGKYEVIITINDWLYGLSIVEQSNSCTNLGFVIVAGYTQSSSGEYSKLLPLSKCTHLHYGHHSIVLGELIAVYSDSQMQHIRKLLERKPMHKRNRSCTNRDS